MNVRVRRLRVRSSLILLEFRRRRESLFGNIRNEKVSASMRPGSGERESPPGTPRPATISQPTPRYASFHARFSTSVQPPAVPAPPGAHAARSPTHTHTRTHMHTGHTHAAPTRGTPRASSPICIFPCSGFSFNVQVFPRGRGRGGGYNGGDMMRGKQYGKNKYFRSVNLTFFSSLKFR